MLDGRRDVMKKWLEKLMRPERSATITLHPTPALAQDAAMSLLDYADRKNCPGGEVFTSPVEDAVNGFIRFSYPVLHQDREIRDVRLWFERGRVVRAEAESGQAYLDEMLRLDEGARHLGELAIGTNRGVTRFTGNVLFDEKIAGTCHLAVGRGFANLGSRNESAIHIDMVCDLKTDSRLSADGKGFYQDGECTISEGAARAALSGPASRPR